MRFRDIILTAILSIGLAFIFYNDVKIKNELKTLNTKITPIEVVEPEYLIPADKAEVEAVIEKYYKTSINQQPAVKIQPKKVKVKHIDIKSPEVIDEIAVYIKQKEGFRATAYKDNTQYSNGYGTRAKSKTEKITMQEANIRLYAHIKKVILPSLDGVSFQSIEQVYAAIDFSYNLGHNRFRQKIVREDGVIDCSKMMAYNKIRDSKGNLIYNEGLAQRRLENFLACASYEIIK